MDPGAPAGAAAGTSQQQQPSWGTLARRCWPQYCAVVLIWAAMRVADPWEPRPRAIYHASDAELWQVGPAGSLSLVGCRGADSAARRRCLTLLLPCIQRQLASPARTRTATGLPSHPASLQYSFPFVDDTLPLWAVPVLSLYLPLAALAAAYAAGWASRLEAHHSAVNLAACVATAGLLGSLLKSQARRGRAPGRLLVCRSTRRTT